MRKVYRGLWYYPIGILLPTVSGFGCGYFFIYLPIQRVFVQHSMPSAVLVGSIPFGVIALIFGLMGLGAILECFSTYAIDSAGIRKAGITSRGEMPWSGITSYRFLKGMSRKIALTDHMGKRMTIYLEMVGKSAELQADIEKRLKALIKRQERDMFSGDRTFRPGRTGGLALGLLAVVSILLGIGAPAFYAGPQANQAYAITVLFVVLGLPLLVLAIKMFSWQLYANESEIGSRSVFGTTIIPYSQVASAIVRDVNTKNGALNTTTIRSEKARITFNSAMAEYAPFRDYVLQHVNADARERGEAEVPRVEKGEVKQGIAALFVICLLGFGLMAAVALPDARQRIKLNDELDHQGRTVTGLVSTTREITGKSTTYYVYYAYPVGNKSFTTSSQISRDSYTTLAEGQPIQVTYLPDKPDVARIPESIGRSVAQGQINLVYGLLAASFVLPVFMYFALTAQVKAKARKRAAQQ